MEHGLAGYVLGCKCRVCKGANAEFRRNRPIVCPVVKRVEVEVEIEEPDPFCKEDLSIADLARMAVWR